MHNNYEEAAIKHTLHVTTKEEEDKKYINFQKKEIEYVLGNKAGIEENSTSYTSKWDKGQIAYSIEPEKGLKIEETGKVTVENYKTVIEEIEKNDGILSVTVTAKKDADKSDDGNHELYEQGEAKYTLKISLAEPEESPIKIYKKSSMEELEPNENGWYNEEVEIRAADESKYEIIRDDNEELKKGTGFAKQVYFDKKDNGDSLRFICLKNISTGEITGKINTNVDKIDIEEKPYDVEIVFPSETQKNGDESYHKGKVTVKFTAKDDFSGVKEFKWEYEGDKEISPSNGTVLAENESSNTYSATITIPENKVDMVKGSIKVKAIDYAGNESDFRDDSGKFILDNILPDITIEYEPLNGNVYEESDKIYYSGDVKFTFIIKEDYLEQKKIKVSVSKDGKEKEETLVWTQTDKQNTYESTLELNEDGAYMISVESEDLSGNKNKRSLKKPIVVDKTKPEISFEYKNNTDKSEPQTAIITVTERNFDPSKITLEAITKNIAGEKIVGKNLQESLSWEKKGDSYKAKISNEFVDGIYNLIINCEDRARNKAVEYTTKTFVVDRTAPKTEEMSITYSTPLSERILSGITFGYYKPKVTVTFTAYDTISGIRFFEWGYIRENVASDRNLEEYKEERVDAVQDAKDKTKFLAEVTLPKAEAEQLRGNIYLRATDNYGNQSDKLTDNNHVIIVDSIAPQISVEYSVAANTVGEKNYYANDIIATFTVTEANFYQEDVKIWLKKNEEIIGITPEWRDVSADVHIGTYTIKAEANHSNDAEYVFLASYKDRSENEMVSYSSDIKVMDTTIPEIHVAYSDVNPMNVVTDSEGHERKYFNTANTATITITERNFNPADVFYTIIAKDAAGNVLNADALYTKSSWTTSGDNHTMTITYSGDANYTFDVAYTDLAKLEAANYKEDYFTVDTTKPENLKISYSESILDTVLSAFSYGFYQGKATVTISATDSISGIHAMKYSYVLADGVSNVNAQLVDQIVNADGIAISDGGATGTASFDIPRSELGANSQFHGTINFTATNKANVESDYLRDTKRIVVDNIAPTANVEYNAPVQEMNGISYYDGDITATVTIYEANFYPEDVNISVTRDGATRTENATWTTNGTDVHTGTFTLSGDGDYTVDITYSDKSSNEMQAYTSEQMTIDTEIVEASITVNGEDADGKAFKDEVVPAVSFEDTNFETCDVKLFRTSFADKNMDVTEQFLSGHISTNETGGNGSFDTFDKIAENDGIYTMVTELKDKAGHTVEKSATFTVNRYGSVYEYSDYLVSVIVVSKIPKSSS